MNRDCIVAITAALFGASCGGSSGNSLPFATGRQSGVADPLSADASHAYAGRVPAGALPSVSTEVEETRVWTEGDYLLANDRIAVVIEDVGASDHFDPWGGKIVGMARVQGGRMIEPAKFYELAFTSGRFTVQTESVTIIDDGSDGSEARIRAIGMHQPIPFIDDVAMAILQADFHGIWVATDYVLEPGSQHVDVELSYFADDPNLGTGVHVNPSLAVALQAYSMQQMVDHGGFASAGDVGWFGYTNRGGTGYAIESLVAESNNIKPGLSIAGASLFFFQPHTYDFDPKQFTPFARIHVGGPDVDALQALVRSSRGTTLRTITGTVVESDGTTPVAGVDVHVRASASEYLTRATTNATGDFSVQVPSTTSPEIFVYRRGQPLEGPTVVNTSTNDVTLTMSPRGTLSLTIVDADTSQPIPAKVQIRSNAGEPGAPAAFGIETNGNDRTFQEWPLTGTLSVPLFPGSHHVTVSRGPEYDILSTDVVITANNVTNLQAALSHDVDTTNALCGDFHLHTNRSPDAPDPVELKLRSAAGEGLEIPVRSDHEWTTDFEPAIAKLGIEQFTFGISSLELTTYWWGHFGIFPLEERFDMPNGGSIDWYDAQAGEGYLHRTPIEVFGDALGRTHPAWGSPAVIINHPRSINTLIVREKFAYFAAMGYDPNTGSWLDPNHDERFKLIEAFNDSDFDANYQTTPVTAANSSTVNDWFSFLERGIDVFVVGSSDSHGVVGSPVGYPRTCIRVGTDSTDALRGMPNGPGHVRDEMLAGHHNVSGGIYVETFARYTAGTGIESGGTVTGAAATEQVHVRVQAPQWVPVDRLRVFVDGALAQDIPIDGSSPGVTAPATRYEADVTVPVRATGRSWVVVVADAATDMTEVYPNGAGGRQPFGVTNPIFFTR